MSLQPGATSYFSAPESTLDPELFDGEKLKGWVREGVLSHLFAYLDTHYTGAKHWANVWLAGSGVSYHWSAARAPGDLDCLVGIDYVNFRRDNPNLTGLSDNEISNTLNEAFRIHVMPATANWHGYELTFYTNPGATDIRSINPYAAYDLVGNTWTVRPEDGVSAPAVPVPWAQSVGRDEETAKHILTRYAKALSEVQHASNPGVRTNAEVLLNASLGDASDLFEEIHHGRKLSFAPTGGGYSDYGNFRWQAGKASGVVPALRALKEYRDTLISSHDLNTYGVELPDADTLIARAAGMYANTLLD